MLYCEIEEQHVSKPHTVIVILEAKEGYEQELKSVLENVIEPSRSENCCLEYRLHKSKNKPNLFVLYENWISEEKHQEQFKKPYILELSGKLEKLLAKPYQAIFAHELYPVKGDIQNLAQ